MIVAGAKREQEIYQDELVCLPVKRISPLLVYQPPSQCARQVRAARTLIAFDRAFLAGEWAELDPLAQHFTAVEPAEGVLR